MIVNDYFYYVFWKMFRVYVLNYSYIKIKLNFSLVSSEMFNDKKKIIEKKI